mmetsp:Transcript_62002/g.115079  ORF Transcript_62002/g.115079 Transcript_62002/m.115079 type:complete len:277 (-) Transcript_62002:51-881(-)
MCEKDGEGKLEAGNVDVAKVLHAHGKVVNVKPTFSLGYNPNVQRRPLVASILEEGSCLQSAQQEMSEGTCYVAPDNSVQQVVWTTQMYHGSKDAQLNRKQCNGGTTSRSVSAPQSLDWGMVCRADEVDGQQVYSLQVRAMYINTSAIRSQNVCSAKADLLFEKSLTIKDWNPAASPGQPRWTCLDIDDKYHLLMHSFGPPPCEPLPEASTVAPSTTGAEATASHSAIESMSTAATSPPVVATASTAVPQTTAKGDAQGSQGLSLLWLVMVISLNLV